MGVSIECDPAEQLMPQTKHHSVVVRPRADLRPLAIQGAKMSMG